MHVLIKLRSSVWKHQIMIQIIEQTISLRKLQIQISILHCLADSDAAADAQADNRRVLFGFCMLSTFAFLHRKHTRETEPEEETCIVKLFQDGRSEHTSPTRIQCSICRQRKIEHVYQSSALDCFKS